VINAALICCIVSCSNKEQVTFVDDIAPIIHENCTPCHRNNGGGPFELITYHDVAKRSKMIAHVTKTKYMPPWPADSEYTSFINEKKLSAEQIQLLQTWWKSGSPSGDTTKINYPKPADYEFPYGKVPDLIIEVDTIHIQGNNRDRFYILKLPYEIQQDTFVKLIEFIPGNKKVVHHVNGHWLNAASPYSEINNPPYIVNIETDTADRGFYNMLHHNQVKWTDRIHSAVNYLPGVRGIIYPEGLGGFTISKQGALILKDIHYGPSNKISIDVSQVHVYFDSVPPLRPVKETMLGTNGIAPVEPPLQIPPGEIKKFTSKAFVPDDISILTINPHMHLLGKSFKAYAVKPNGDTIRLISIPNWNFRWQYYYTFAKMIKIPRGSSIQIEAIFDNTSDNPNNPFDPPQWVGERNTRSGASMRTTDEMLQFIITYLPYVEGDENINLK
jgi:hypothetical protein